MKLDMDTFGRIIDDFLTENEVHMLLAMLEGTQDVTVRDNTELGPVGQFYFILAAIVQICRAMQEQIGIDAHSADWEKVADVMLGMVRREILPKK